MRSKDTYGIYNSNTAEHISLLKYSKSSCGVDFLLNTAESMENVAGSIRTNGTGLISSNSISSARQRDIFFWQANG